MSRFFLLAVVLAVLLAIATAASSSSSSAGSSSSAPVASSSSSSSAAVASSSSSSASTASAATSSSPSSTGSSTGVAPVLTFCQTYSSPTNGTLQVGLITAIVVRAVGGGIFADPANAGQSIVIPGLFNASGPLYSIFTGQTMYRAGAPNYVNDSAALGTLATHLVQYFGVLFGCTAQPGYPAVNNANMYAVHRNMNITQPMETYFNTQLALTLLSFGVPSTVVNTVAAPVLGWFNKCGPPISSIDPNAPVQICGDASCTVATDATYQSCISYYGYPGSSSSSSGGISVNPSSAISGVLLPSSSTGATNSSNSASGKYAMGAVSVAAAAVVATLLL